jgi:hypothetical protein
MGRRSFTSGDMEDSKHSELNPRFEVDIQLVRI